MNLSLSLYDLIALAPQLCILAGALALLLIESFYPQASKCYSLFITASIFTIAGLLTLIQPQTTNPLLTHWLQFDSFSEGFSLIAFGIGIATLLLSHTFFNRFHVSPGEYCVFLLCSVFGIQLIAYAADFLTLFLGLEMLSVATYVLCGYVKKWTTGNESSLKYFLMGSFASALFLYGVALVYGAIGHTSLISLLDSYQDILASPERTLFLGGIALISFGLFFKAAIVPFHFWAPDVYAGAPTPIAAFMALGIKTAAFAALMRVFWGSLQYFDPLWNKTAQCLIYATLIYANSVAMRQIYLRRFFAYSGISHAGFLLIPLVVGGTDGAIAFWIYLATYLLATAGAFAVLAILDNHSGGPKAEDLKGLFKDSPFLAMTFTLCLLTLAGFPPTLGFFAKFSLFKLAYAKGYYDLVILGLVTSVFSAFYYFRWIAAMFQTKQEKTERLPCLPEKSLAAASVVLLTILSFFPSLIFL